ncbi:MAG: methyltransferase type 12, partial [Planctomycetota bacterium]
SQRAPGGLLLVGSPYTWKEEFTPRARWLGRVGDGGAEVRARLLPRFLREAETDMLFFIPHHARSGQLGRTHIQSFRRQP